MKQILFFAIFIFLSCSILSAQSQTCTDSVGYLTEEIITSAEDEVVFLNLTSFFVQQVDPPANITFVETESATVVVTLGTDCYFDSKWGLGDHGEIQFPILGDATDIYSTPDEIHIVITISPPISSFTMKANYNPGFVASEYGDPIFKILDETGTELACYSVDALSPISTIEGALIGATHESGIAQIRIQGGNLAVWDFTFVRAALPPVAAPVDAPVAAPTSAPVASPVAATPQMTPVKRSAASSVTSALLGTAALVLAAL